MILISLWLAPTVTQAQIRAEIQQRRHWKYDGLTFDNNFSGARMNDLFRLSEGKYVAVIRPETRPINPSPWYGFAIDSGEARSIEVTLRMDGGNDRGAQLRASRPWMSTDGLNYHPIENANWDPKGLDATARLQVPVGRLWISAWKPCSLEHCFAWMDLLEKQPFVRGSVLGISQEGRPLRQLSVGNPEAKTSIVVLGGQHPPEITGSIGLFHFVEEIAGESELAVRFRQSFQTIVLPMLNPDGKYHGHWRSTLGGVDPNRDWFDFTQVEVSTVADHLIKHAAGGGRAVAMGIDFHSTNKDFFYVYENASVATSPESSFTTKWFTAIRTENKNRKIEQEEGRPLIPAAGNWMRSRLQCPAYTREFRYDQPDEEVADEARSEARALMRLLLQGGHGAK